HKEILFFLGIRLYTTQKLADLRGQTERNIRKVRDTVQRRIYRKLYTALTELQKSGDKLIHLEQDFLRDYTPPKRRHSSDEEPV
ncbi:MAG: sigma-70 family RNA polymerase sigma factor, partial [Clostridia bacterium]|nr:sigma-70 family RNA polymerase sigma factor [Clostridia bacterium]